MNCATNALRTCACNRLVREQTCWGIRAAAVRTAPIQVRKVAARRFE